MAKLSHLIDLYLLAMLERGCQSLYDLQHEAGISLGASIPALKRLKKAGMVKQGEDRSKGKRVRFEFKLTASGRREAKQGWYSWLDGEPPTDIDAILRLIDLGLHYGLPEQKIADFTMRAAQSRKNRAAQAVSHAKQTPSQRYRALRAECEAVRLTAEASALEVIADRIPARKKKRAYNWDAPYEGLGTMFDHLKKQNTTE